MMHVATWFTIKVEKSCITQGAVINFARECAVATTSSQSVALCQKMPHKKRLLELQLMLTTMSPESA